MIITKDTRKTFKIRGSGRSTDFISPSFGYGCLYDCSYCYMKRHKPKGLSVATNTNDILTAINNHAAFAVVDKPNQTHPVYTTYDISCNEDFALHAKYHNWTRIFNFFKEHPTAMGSFATKYVNPELTTFNPEGKIRIRFRIYYSRKINNMFVDRKYKHKVLSEVIFLTHNKNKHIVNLSRIINSESTLWTPKNQEAKTSQYGGENIRYEHKLKREYIKDFISLHTKIIPWNTIRYIF